MLVTAGNLEKERFRLFLASPVRRDAADELYAWAVSHLDGLPAKLISPEQMHVSLMFFGEVDAERRDEIVALLAEVTWEPILVETGKLEIYSHRSVGPRLDADHAALELLEDRLGRTCFFSAPENLRERFRADDPLVEMSRFISVDDLEKKRRRQRQGIPLTLHVTLARSIRGSEIDVDRLPMPTLRFELERPVLFQSTREATRARHDALA